VKPPAGIELEDVKRATGDVGAGVGICESEAIASPQVEQNRLFDETCAEHEGHVMTGVGVAIAGKGYRKKPGCSNNSCVTKEDDPIPRLP
jgi:hypothetical protein